MNWFTRLNGGIHKKCGTRQVDNIQSQRRLWLGTVAVLLLPHGGDAIEEAPEVGNGQMQLLVQVTGYLDVAALVLADFRHLGLWARHINRVFKIKL